MGELRGKLVSGVQKAAHFTQLGWVRDQCLEKLGFIPFPGTVNLEVTKEHFSTLKALRKQDGIRLVPPDSQFCESTVFPVTLGHIRGALIIPDEKVRVHGRAVIEILAPVKVKDALGLVDGDMVSLGLREIEAPED